MTVNQSYNIYMSLLSRLSCKGWVRQHLAPYWWVVYDQANRGRDVYGHRERVVESVALTTHGSHIQRFNWDLVDACVSTKWSSWTWPRQLCCDRCLLITKRPKAPSHYRYLIWVLCYIPYMGLNGVQFCDWSCSCVYCDFEFLKFVFSTLRSRSWFKFN